MWSELAHKWQELQLLLIDCAVFRYQMGSEKWHLKKPTVAMSLE